MKRKLTDLTVPRIKKPKSGRLEVWDTLLPAFGFRISATGARTWIVATRRPGATHPVRLKVGTPDEPDRMSLADARAKARQLMEGNAPELPVTFKDLAGQFLEHGRTKRGRPLRPATKKEYKRALLTYAAPLHAKPVRGIRRGEIAGLIRDVANTRGSTSAMRTRAALSRFWGWMLASDLVDANVVVGTEGYSTPKRQRVLLDGELRALWAATEERSDFNMIVRLCFWLGTRRSEPGGMDWNELDGGTWTVPGERTKNHRPLVLPLPRQALAAIKGWPRIVGRKRLFGRAIQKPGEKELRERGFQGWSQAKARLDNQIARANAERRLTAPRAHWKRWVMLTRQRLRGVIRRGSAAHRALRRRSIPG
ncbi:MAG: tyrosine-type recombinase/integrase, partial [Geminicoccaceae bacterium]